MEEEKVNYLRIILVTLIALILVVIIAVIVYFWVTQDQNPIETISKFVAPDDNPSDSDDGSGGGFIPGDDTSATSGGGGGASSDGGGGSSGGDSSLTCTNVPVAYSITDMSDRVECRTYDGSVCTEKTIYCSANINNRGDSLGYFKVELYYFESGTNRTTDRFDSDIRDFTLEAKGRYYFEGSTTVTSSGEDGLANQRINCFFETVGEPYTQVCS